MERKRRSYEDWLLIAGALQVGRTEVMQAVHTNKPTGGRYERAMGEWLLARSFHLIDKCTRNHLLECLQHRAEIAKWRANLTEAERFKFNHLTTVLRKWKGSTVVPDPNAKPKPSLFAQTKDALVRALEENHRLQEKIKTADGDLWKSADTASDIAGVMIAALSPAKAERTAREILKKLKERKAMRPSVEAGRVQEGSGFDAH
jgi:acyl-CoA synthetase (NDP forming)